MSKVLKAFICGLALTGVVLVPACKTKKTPPPVVAPTVTTTTSTPPPPVDTTVRPPEDFVKTDTAEPKVSVEALPADIDQLNRVVQEKGHVRGHAELELELIERIGRVLNVL